MRDVTRGLMLLSLVLAVLAGWSTAAVGQVATTTVQDTVYRADGTLAAGTVLVSWGAFTTMTMPSVAVGLGPLVSL